jgi:hypothetical protein
MDTDRLDTLVQAWQCVQHCGQASGLNAKEKHSQLVGAQTCLSAIRN